MHQSRGAFLGQEHRQGLALLGEAHGVDGPGVEGKSHDRLPKVRPQAHGAMV